MPSIKNSWSSSGKKTLVTTSIKMRLKESTQISKLIRMKRSSDRWLMRTLLRVTRLMNTKIPHKIRFVNNPSKKIKTSMSQTYSSIALMWCPAMKNWSWKCQLNSNRLTHSCRALALSPQEAQISQLLSNPQIVALIHCWWIKIIASNFKKRRIPKWRWTSAQRIFSSKPKSAKRAWSREVLLEKTLPPKNENLTEGSHRHL